VLTYHVAGAPEHVPEEGLGRGLDDGGGDVAVGVGALTVGCPAGVVEHAGVGSDVEEAGLAAREEASNSANLFRASGVGTVDPKLAVADGGAEGEKVEHDDAGLGNHGDGWLRAM
jgi:hypothetical protein